MDTPLPQSFLDMLAAAGTPLFDRLPAALDGEAPSIAVRLNPVKAAGRDITPALADGIVPWEPQGRYLAERPAFTFDPLLHQGAYYVQDPSSMITGLIVRTLLSVMPDRPLVMLDACAAPGGKTTAALAALPPGSVMVANEFTPSRVAPLAENLARWGNPDAVVTSQPVGKLARLAPAAFDIVAVDAPCSGEGMMRKDADARSQWTDGLTRSCAALQREILADAWTALRPGGYLIYSTCTFNTRENEENHAWLVTEFGAEPVEIPVDSSWGIAGAIGSSLPAMRFIPGLVRGEGLFAAVVRKPGTLPENAGGTRNTGRRTGNNRDKHAASPVSAWLAEPSAFTVRERGDSLDLMPVSPLLPQEIAAICRPAVCAATVKGRDIIPDTSLAWSSALRPDAFPTVDVDTATAVAFLRREALRLPDGAPRGIVMLGHAGLPLGFVKNLGNRANNLHRASWRILSQGDPATILI